VSGTADGRHDGGRIPRREFAKRATAAGLGLTGLSSFLAACGGGSGSSATSGASASVSIPTRASGHIDLLGWDANASTAAGDALKARRAAWLKANPGASLTFQPGPVDNYTAVVTTRSRARKLADVVEMLGERYFESAFPALKPLSRDMFPDLKDTLSLWDSTTISADDPDRHAGVPIGASGSVWYYNKALFQKAGLDPEKVPTTWAELTDMVNQIKAAGITPVALSGDYIGALNLWYPHLVQFFPTPADVTAFRTGAIPLTDERFVHSLEPLVQANKDGWWSKDFLGKTATDMEADFANGKAALVCGLVGGLVNWPVWDKKLGKDAYGVFAGPTMPKAEKQVFFWYPDFMYSINKDTDNLPAAMAFVNYLASKESLTLGLKLGGAMPNRTDIDVAAVSGSKGAAEIARLAKTLPLVDVPTSFLEPAATDTMFKTTGPAIKNGDIGGFLSRLQQQNKT
jgi:ABC-type glycerol-3-phosphate transport system substrate-binding protein